MSTYETITAAQTDAKSPINETLMQGNEGTQTGGVRHNFEALKDRIVALEASSGGGGGGAADNGAIGEITLGGETDEGVYWKRRFSPFQNLNTGESNDSKEGFDPEGKKEKEELLHFLQSNDNSSINYISNSTAYNGEYITIDKSSKISFKIKSGINFFSLGYILATGSNNLEILIDGQTPSALGLVDENGNAAPDFINQLSGQTYFQKTSFFYGLDGDEHVVELTNNDSGSNVAFLEFVEVGYKTTNPTIDETVNIKAGKALVRGGEVTFAETDLTFGKTDKNGHTGAIVSTDAGVLSALDGESPAMTQVRHEEEVDFTGTVTSLPVKTNLFFPDSGICLASLPDGNTHMFSYGSKTATTPQTNTLDNVLWQSKPNQSFTPGDNFESTSLGDGTGDLNINYWGTAPINITSSNNRLDFAVTIGGVRTVHAATITQGRYSADLVPIEKAIREAMRAVKSINGEYHCKYDETTQLWTIYVDSEEVEDFELLFSSGANQADSIHPTLGFASSDFSGDLSYLAATEVQHLCCKVFEADKNFMYANDPRIKYDRPEAGGNNDKINYLEEQLGVGYVRYFSSGVQGYLMQIFPDDDCSGLSFSFVADNQGAMITAQIDDGPSVYVLQTDSYSTPSTTRPIIKTGFISFPKGSRKITIRQESDSTFKIRSNSSTFIFVGARQYYTKPAYEKLPLTQSVIKTFEVSPVSLYATTYGHNGGSLYSPAGSNDNINTITESGSWSGLANTDGFNAGSRVTTTQNSYVEVDFTLQGDGGGILMTALHAVAYSRKTSLFISQVAINEATDRIKNTSLYLTGAATYYDSNSIGHLGLPAGTYKARFKEETTGNTLRNSGFIIVDTVHPEENKNTVTDLSNTGQGVAYPYLNVKRTTMLKDNIDRIPLYLERSGFKEGMVNIANGGIQSPSYANYDDQSALITYSDQFYGSFVDDDRENITYQLSAFCKSVSYLCGAFNNKVTAPVTQIDGVATLNTHSQRVQVKGGSAPSAVRNSAARLVQKQFELSCSFSSGDTFTIADTRGLKNDQVVLLFDGTSYERAVISSFVVGTSFTVKKARSTVVDANVTKVFFPGFHSIKLVQDTAIFMNFGAWEYEPLTITPSKALARQSVNLVTETRTIIHRDIADDDDIFYPMHSDGIPGNWSTSSIELIGSSAGSAFEINEDLKNITVSSGTIDIKITSTRLVPEREY